MRTIRWQWLCVRIFVATGLLVCWPGLARSQSASNASPDAADDVKSLAASVRELQAQVQVLNQQMNEIRAAAARAERDADALRIELKNASSPNAPVYAGNREAPETSNSTGLSVTTATSPASAGQGPAVSVAQEISDLQENQSLLNDKIVEQSQTKVESASKYRVRLSGIVLLNTGITRGAVDNLDFAEIATPPQVPNTSGAFSGSLRQSQIGLEVFGPDIAGARTSANLKFDFAGGFPDAPNGAVLGVVRLRTGTIRLDWEDTSLIAGQDTLFTSPLVPTSLASLAIPPLSYSGNLWTWTPQIRVEHRVHLSEGSNILLQAGILDSLTGDFPEQQNRTPTFGEQSGQPAYGARVAWTGKLLGRDVTLGSGGYYGRQNWGFGRNVDGWAASADASVALGSLFDVDAEFYRGRAVGGFGGGIGQSVLLSGAIADPGTTIRGLDSLGGWVQLKYKPKANFELNFAIGQDNPFAGELRAYPATAGYYGSSLLSRNLSPFANFIYRVRSDVLVSVEYRRLQTNTLDGTASLANQITLSLGYLF
jgi:outer membrane murein-binding lipoprotein Lpp